MATRCRLITGRANADDYSDFIQAGLRQTDTGGQADRQTDRQTDIQASRQTDRMADRQAGRWYLLVFIVSCPS